MPETTKQPASTLYYGHIPIVLNRLLPPASILPQRSAGIYMHCRAASFLWGPSLLGTIHHTILLPRLICVHCHVVWVTVIKLVGDERSAAVLSDYSSGRGLLLLRRP